MIHTIAFSESQDLAGVLGYVAGVPDQTVRVSGDDIVVPAGPNKIIGAMACAGATATRALLVAPSLRRLNPLEIQPLELALFPTTPQPLFFWGDSPTQLDVNEALNCQIISDPAAAERASIVVWLADAAPKPISGKVFKARFTTTTTLVAGQWVNSQIDFADDLPAGVYRMGGAQLVAATGVAARFYPAGGPWRPGIPVLQTLGGRQDTMFRNFAMGEWFQFDQTVPPTIDILSSAAAASATYVGVMDLIAA